MAGRIIRTNVIGFVNDAASQKPGPDAIGDVAGEPGILGGDQPIGKDFARIPVRGQPGSRSIRENGGLRPRIGGVRIRFARIEINNFLLPFQRGLETDLREKGRHTRHTVGGPLVRAHAHERQGHGLGDTGRFAVLHGAVEVDRTDAEIAAARGEQLACEPS